MIALKSTREIASMRTSARKLKTVLEELTKFVRVGMTTFEIDRKAESLIHKQMAQPAFKGYRGFPACVCTSLNEEVVHGIPSKKRILKEGDLLSIDMGLIYDGFYSDCARTWILGRGGEEASKLIDVAHKALYLGMAEMRPGNRIGDLGNAIQTHVESNGFSVVRDFVGHGIGRALHEDPQVPNFGKSGKGPKVEVGMVLALEPMVTAGGWEVEILEDHWTVVTRDRRLSSHYEDTITLTEDGAENLTGPQKYQTDCNFTL